jgi:hypothetical protein
MMLFTGIANPAQLEVMTDALNVHCIKHNIVNADDRAAAAQRVMLMFNSGARTVEQLIEALESSRANYQSGPSPELLT